MQEITMADTPTQNTRKSVPHQGARKKAPKDSFAFRVFNLILQYKETKTFQWVSRHPEISIGLIGLWGMLIVIFFLWFVFSRIVR